MRFYPASSPGVTLTELLVVIAIIAILTALLATYLRQPLKQRQMLEATSMVSDIALALKKLKEDCKCEDVFARGSDGRKVAELFDTDAAVRELAPIGEFAGYAPRLNLKKIPYLELKQRAFKGGQLVDPWGKAYRCLVYVHEANGWPYETEAVYSSGPDGVAQNEDDIVRIVQEFPAQAKKDDASRPAQTADELKSTCGWIDKPGGWK
jgi:prepilin-type N-terminal cleavage/methylation domain-containing protein